MRILINDANWSALLLKEIAKTKKPHTSFSSLLSAPLKGWSNPNYNIDLKKKLHPDNVLDKFSSLGKHYICLNIGGLTNETYYKHQDFFRVLSWLHDIFNLHPTGC